MLTRLRQSFDRTPALSYIRGSFSPYIATATFVPVSGRNFRSAGAAHENTSKNQGLVRMTQRFHGVRQNLDNALRNARRFCLRPCKNDVQSGLANTSIPERKLKNADAARVYGHMAYLLLLSFFILRSTDQNNQGFAS